MGGAMAATLHRAGFDLVLWNRDNKKARSLARELGVVVAPTPGEAAAAADFVLSSLADDEAVTSVYLGERGVRSTIRRGTIAIETSTIDPETTRAVGDAIDESGASFLDCPVSGSVSAVQAGTLTIMAGGPEEIIDRADPVLRALASKVVPTGPRGTGSATKLAVNALVHGLNVALSESLVFAERAGIDRLVAYEVFANGAGGAPFVHYKRQAFEQPENAAVGFTLDLVQKDLELITRLASRVGAPMEQARIGLGLVERAIAAGYGNADLSALAVFLRSQ
jgi:3-hydroxyisobutyrate dehydrogenase/2-hydroxy-3-oxopropionate reductase